MLESRMRRSAPALDNPWRGLGKLLVAFRCLNDLMPDDLRMWPLGI